MVYHTAPRSKLPSRERRQPIRRGARLSAAKIRNHRHEIKSLAREGWKAKGLTCPQLFSTRSLMTCRAAARSVNLLSSVKSNGRQNKQSLGNFDLLVICGLYKLKPTMQANPRQTY